MLRITSLLLLLSLQAISGTKLKNVRANCDPDCSTAKDGDRVENPKDCHTYYVCFSNHAMGPVDCPDGQFFNSTAGNCVANGPVECKPSCGGGSCTYECNDPSIPFRADRYDCSTYHDCASGAMMRCDKDKPFFNGEACQTDESKCCHCKPYCYTDDKGHLVMDPTDCTKYYLCLDNNTIPDASGRCSTGNFDPFTQKCSLSTPCLTFCANVVKPDGCIHTYTCQKTGKFAACPHKCTQDYFHCLAADIGSVVAATSCTGDYVFHPNLGYCVVPTACSL
ncbi:Peritrophin-44 [Portunus trituberculatus]|uniref:Peritrophin-44 n=1 Tax=Portunus trituberculatus TaxID=210409 RepID=A0A5B7GZ41_PORTR|nr:Peritrophin-44 [Portunus trituberculatus]